MLDFETAWAQQEDLDKLTAWRAPRMREVYWANNNYGFARAMKEYAKYPIMKPVFGVVPHGVYLNADQELFPGERDAPVPAVFPYPEFMDDAWREQSDKIVLPACSPFLYALALMKGQIGTERRKGTLYFPKHSTEKNRFTTETARVIEMLKALPEKCQPVTVSAHWYDYSQGLHKPYEEAGFQIVSAGHFHDDEFVFRLIHLMSAHAYVSGDGVGSSLFYALAAGVPSFLLDVTVTSEKDDDFYQLAPSMEALDRRERTRQLFLEIEDQINEEQLEAADFYLGWNRMKSPEGLRDDLMKAAMAANRA